MSEQDTGYDPEQPQWERFDSVRSINAIIRLALAEIRKEEGKDD